MSAGADSFDAAAIEGIRRWWSAWFGGRDDGANAGGELHVRAHQVPDGAGQHFPLLVSGGGCWRRVVDDELGKLFSRGQLVGQCIAKALQTSDIDIHSQTPYVARAATRYVTGAILTASRWLQRKAGIRQATDPLAPSDATGEAGAAAAPASPPRHLTEAQRRNMIAGVLPSSFTLPRCMTWPERLAVVDAVREAVAVIADYEAGAPVPGVTGDVL